MSQPPYSPRKKKGKIPSTTASKPSYRTLYDGLYEEVHEGLGFLEEVHDDEEDMFEGEDEHQVDDEEGEAFSDDGAFVNGALAFDSDDSDRQGLGASTILFEGCKRSKKKRGRLPGSKSRKKKNNGRDEVPRSIAVKKVTDPFKGECTLLSPNKERGRPFGREWALNEESEINKRKGAKSARNNPPLQFIDVSSWPADAPAKEPPLTNHVTALTTLLDDSGLIGTICCKVSGAASREPVPT